MVPCEQMGEKFNQMKLNHNFSNKNVGFCVQLQGAEKCDPIPVDFVCHKKHITPEPCCSTEPWELTKPAINTTQHSQG